MLRIQLKRISLQTYKFTKIVNNVQRTAGLQNITFTRYLLHAVMIQGFFCIFRSDILVNVQRKQKSV